MRFTEHLLRTFEIQCKFYTFDNSFKKFKLIELIRQISTSGRSKILPTGGGRVPTPQVGVRTYFFGRKLHENERISLAPPPLDPPLSTETLIVI